MSRNLRSESHLEKIAREGAASVTRQASDSQALRDKTSRLRSLRLAKEAADAEMRVTKKP